MRAVERRLAQAWTRRSADHGGSFRAWLFRVARNLCVDRFRAIARRETATGDSQVARRLAEIPDDCEGETAALELAYRRALLHRAALHVRPRVNASSWQSFWRTAIDGEKPELVARDLGVSLGVVYTSKCRVLARIKEAVARLDEAGLDIAGLDQVGLDGDGLAAPASLREI